MALWLITFVAGVFTVLSPCTLPLLPVLFGVSALPGKRLRIHIVLIAFALSVLVLTIWLKVVFTQLPFDQDDFRLLSAVVFIMFGALILLPRLWDQIIGLLWVQQSISSFLDRFTHSPWYEVVLGLLLGPLFNSCSPTYLLLIATILPTDFWNGIVATLVYLLWVCMTLGLLFAWGQFIFRRVRLSAWVLQHTKKIFAIGMLLLGIALRFGADKWLSTEIISAWWGIDTTTWEAQLLR